MSARHWFRCIVILAALIYVVAVIINGAVFIPAGSLR